MAETKRPPGIVDVARCPEHGLHGQRDTCFECGGPVEQVAMIDVADDELVGFLRIGLGTDGGHHKQWALRQVALVIGMKVDDYDEGVPP